MQTKHLTAPQAQPQIPHSRNSQIPQSHQQQHQSPPSKKDAFEKFKHQHPDYASSQANHAILKEKYAVAKDYSERVNQARDKINGYIALIEQLRVERAMQGLMNKDRENDKDKDKKDLEEERTKALIEKEKSKYKEYCEMLQQVKSEIDTLQAMIKNTNVIIQKDFMSWYHAVYGGAPSRATPSPIPNAPSPAPSSTAPSHHSSSVSSPRSTTTASPSTPRSHLLHSSRPSSPSLHSLSSSQPTNQRAASPRVYLT